MLDGLTPSIGLFGLAWALLCLIAGALVTDTLLRDGSVDGRSDR